MKAKLLAAFGYQGDAMALPVADAEASATFYERAFGLSVVDRKEAPARTVVLERDGVRMAVTESGGDPEQDGCAFHTDDIETLRDEFISNGLDKIGDISSETRKDGSRFRAFFAVAPDGLCFWFGQRVSDE